MHRSTSATALLGLSLLVFSGCLLSGCKEDTDQSPVATGAAALSAGGMKCKNGIDRALKASTIADANSIYYTECSALFSQPACRDAWVAAAALPSGQQIPKIADACRKAYCPSLAALSFEACRDDFAATPEALTKAWPTLFDAILTREVGTSAPELSSRMLVLYVHLKQLQEQNPTSIANQGTTVPSSSGSAAASATPSASPPPPASAPASGDKAPHAKPKAN